MSPPARYRLIAAVLFVGGLAAAVAIYARTSPDDDDGASYNVEGGTAYVVRLDDSKSHERQLERMSGKTGVLAAEFMDWLAARWQGRNLAYTVGTLSVVGALGCLFLSHFQLLDPAPPAKPGGENS